MLDGKGGGRPESAQATGNNPGALSEAIKKAVQFAQSKLNICSAPVETKKAKLDYPTVLYSAPGSIRGSIALVAARYSGKSLHVQPGTGEGFTLPSMVIVKSSY